MDDCICFINIFANEMITDSVALSNSLILTEYPAQITDNFFIYEIIRIQGNLNGLVIFRSVSCREH